MSEMFSTSPGDGPGRDRQMISASQLFDEKRTSRFAVATVFALGSVLVAAVGWSAVMPLAEIATSAGEIVTAEAVQRVQHLEGGIVARVLVEEGEDVAEGQTLLELAPTIAETELSQLRTRRTAARVRVELLSAALTGDLPEPSQVATRDRAIVAAEIQALEARRRSFESQAAVLRRQADERQTEREILDIRHEALERQIALGQEKIDAQRTLFESGNMPRLRIIDEERGLLQLISDQSEMDIEKIRLTERIHEAEARIAELTAMFQSDLAAEISTLTNEVAELDLAISQASDRVGRLIVTAPVAGRVQDMQIRSGGGVVAPGAQLMNIVPANAQLRVEARISTGDVGHVRVGQPVEIKVQTFDYSRFGKLDGEIGQISPTTFLDPSGTPYYRATIDLAADHMADHDDLRLAPGMTVTADIVTGSRTLLTYLASPILKSFSSGLRER